MGEGALAPLSIPRRFGWRTVKRGERLGMRRKGDSEFQAWILIDGYGEKCTYMQAARHICLYPFLCLAFLRRALDIQSTYCASFAYLDFIGIWYTDGEDGTYRIAWI